MALFDKFFKKKRSKHPEKPVKDETELDQTKPEPVAPPEEPQEKPAPSEVNVSAEPIVPTESQPEQQDITIPEAKEVPPEPAKTTPKAKPEKPAAAKPVSKPEAKAVPKPKPETKTQKVKTPAVKPVPQPEPKVESQPVTKPKKAGLFSKLKASLSKTRQSLGGGIASLLKGKKQIDDELLDDLETTLITADVGVEVAQNLIGELTEALGRKQLKDGDAVLTALKTSLAASLTDVAKPLVVSGQQSPFVILFVGVNGAGKTTTIGKLAKQLQRDGKSVMLAAGDTFRAAAVEQLEIWGERNKIPVISQKTGADSASVIFDGVQSAKAKNIDVLIADTAGRLHSKSNLMAELQKVVRVIQKQMPEAPHEIMLVLDASMGQNALLQAQQFHDAVGVTGITLTKLDGTAKGGILFAISQKLQIPIRFIGVGESIDDLQTFNATEFVDAVLGE